MRSINLYDLTGLPLQFPQRLPDDWLLVLRHRDDAFRHRPIWIHDEESDLIHVLRPVESSRTYHRIGYLDITLYAQMFQRLFADLDFGGGGQIALYDEKGKIITGSFPDEDLARKALLCQEDTCELAVDGTYLFARKIPSLGWTVVSSISRREAHGSVLRLIGYVLLAIIFLTLMVFVLSLSYARYTRKRIQYLVDAMNQFAQGAHGNRQFFPPDNRADCICNRAGWMAGIHWEARENCVTPCH